MDRLGRACATIAIACLPLAGCNSAGMSTSGIDVTTTQALGGDSHGNRIADNDLTQPWSNQVSLDGDQSRRYLELGRENFRDGNYGNAEMNFRKAVEIRPDNVAAWLGLAASYDQVGRFDLADRAYDQLQKLKRNDAKILNNRGYSYMLRGDYEKARSYFNYAQKLDPSLEEVQGNLLLLEKVRKS
jgi:Flp pilus assembly protein TadD